MGGPPPPGTEDLIINPTILLDGGAKINNFIKEPLTFGGVVLVTTFCLLTTFNNRRERLPAVFLLICGAFIPQ